MVGLGELALADGDADAARDAAERVLRRLPGAPLDRLPALELLVRAQATAGDVEAARSAHADLAAVASASGTPYLSGRSYLAGAELELAAGAAEAARCAAEDAIDCFTASSAPYDGARAGAAASDAASALTARELEVLRLVAQGLGDAEVAERLVVSPHTVHRHVANIRNKLRLPSRAAAVAYAAREGLI